MRLLAELRRESGLTLLFVSHNLALVRRLCERVLVLYLGRMMELAPARELYERPAIPTRASCSPPSRARIRTSSRHASPACAAASRHRRSIRRAAACTARAVRTRPPCVRSACRSSSSRARHTRSPATASASCPRPPGGGAASHSGAGALGCGAPIGLFFGHEDRTSARARACATSATRSAAGWRAAPTSSSARATRSSPSTSATRAPSGSARPRPCAWP